MKKQWVSILLVVALSVIVLGGCGKSNSKETNETQTANKSVTAESTNNTNKKADSDDVTITWAVFETDNYTAEVWQHIIDAFEADNPGIKIEKVLMTGDSRPQFLKTMLSAGELPDVNIDPVELAKVDGVYAEVPEELLSRYEDSAVVSFNGKKTLVPAYKALRSQTYYHKDQFKKAGITQEPKTWDEYAAACQKLSAAGLTPLITGGTSDIWATSFGFWTGVANAEIMDAYPNFNQDIIEGKISWTDPVIVNVIQKWKDLIDAGYYHKGSMSFSYTQANSEFKDGNAAMFMDGSWCAPTYDTEGISPDEIGVFVTPAPSGAKNYCTMPQYWAVSETCKNKEAAFKFCEYVLGGNPDIYRYYLQADGTYSVTKDPVTYEVGPIQQKLIDNYQEYKLVPEIMKQVGDYSMPTGFEDFTCKSLQNIFAGADIKEELKTWDTEFQRLLNQQ